MLSLVRHGPKGKVSLAGIATFPVTLQVGHLKLSAPVYAFADELQLAAQSREYAVVQRLCSKLSPRPAVVRADWSTQRTFWLGANLSRACGLSVMTGVPVQTAPDNRMITSTDPVTSSDALFARVPAELERERKDPYRRFEEVRGWLAQLLPLVLTTSVDLRSQQLDDYLSVCEILSYAPNGLQDWKQLAQLGWPIRTDLAANEVLIRWLCVQCLPAEDNGFWVAQHPRACKYYLAPLIGLLQILQQQQNTHTVLATHAFFLEFLYGLVDPTSGRVHPQPWECLSLVPHNNISGDLRFQAFRLVNGTKTAIGTLDLRPYTVNAPHIALPAVTYISIVSLFDNNSRPDSCYRLLAVVSAAVAIVLVVLSLYLFRRRV